MEQKLLDARSQSDNYRAEYEKARAQSVAIGGELAALKVCVNNVM